MKKKLLSFLNKIWQSVLFWALTMMFFGALRFYGIDQDEGITIEPGYEDMITLRVILPLMALFGAVMGIVYGSVEYLFDGFVSKRLSLGIRTLIKLVVYYLSLIIIMTLLIEFVIYLYAVNLNNEVGWWREDKTFRMLLLYTFLAALVFSFIKISNEKFGRGVFLKMLLGKYKKPVEERRIFMFLDLKSSTTIAERLGHFKYSQLIQDCFYDLNEVVPNFGAEIYQYVGDEAVLSWPYKKGLADNQCVRLFFSFQSILRSKEDYYRSKYDWVPEFKAGLHGGSLMVAEVGVVKKELAFHGDVINTSARIQAECNTYDVPILLSEQLLEDLETPNEFVSESLGSVLLKGKNEKVNIYTLVKSQ